MSKQYAHLYTMAKTSVKFQSDWPKTVGGVALTRHPVTIRVLGKKTTKLTKRKKLKKKKKSENYEQTICTSIRYGQNICEVSKRLAKNCRRSCAHKSTVDERTGQGMPISHLRALFVLRFYGPVNPMGSCRARSVYLTTRLLGRLSPLSG